MARTLDPVGHAVRRDAFVDAATRLITVNGYERTSIADVLEATGASRGAFYHYFDSKEALLEAVVDRMADVALDSLQPVIDDPDLTAPAKFEALFRGIARWKGDRRDLVLAILEAWLASNNAIVRERFRRLVATRMTPILTGFIRQGTAEGFYRVASPDATATILVTLVTGVQELAGHLFVARQRGDVTFAEVEATFTAYADAVDRILGAAPGTLTMLDRDTLLEWFG